MPRLLTVALTALLFLGALPSPAAAKKLSPGETVDVNTAGFDDLLRVPGIGKTRARAILEYREGHGPFGTLDELDKVKGIGKKSLKKLVPWLRIGGPATPVPSPDEVRSPEAPRPPDAADPAPASKPSPGSPGAGEKAPVVPKDEGKGATDVEVL